jgi:hypothetical protein
MLFFLLLIVPLRFSNMDYMVGSVMRLLAVLIIIISYDVACQWFVNLKARIDGHWPEKIRPIHNTTLVPAVPKLHEPSHEKVGHEQFSFNYLPGIGATDGECIERIWAGHNALGNSTKTSGPGNCQDTLDDHFLFWNWEKYISMGECSHILYHLLG